MFSLASSKLRRHKKKNKQSHNNERTTTNNHQPEFQLKVRRGNESEIQEVPLWIPLSIMAGKSAKVLFYDMNSCAQYKVSATWLFYLTLICLY